MRAGVERHDPLDRAHVVQTVVVEDEVVVDVKLRPVVRREAEAVRPGLGDHEASAEVDAEPLVATRHAGETGRTRAQADGETVDAEQLDRPEGSEVGEVSGLERQVVHAAAQAAHLRCGAAGAGGWGEGNLGAHLLGLDARCLRRAEATDREERDHRAKMGLHGESSSNCWTARLIVVPPSFRLSEAARVWFQDTRVSRSRAWDSTPDEEYLASMGRRLRWSSRLAFALALAGFGCEPASPLHPLLQGSGNGGGGGSGAGGAVNTTGPTSGVGASGAGGAGTGGTACTSKGFSTPADFALPPGYSGVPNGAKPFADIAGSLACQNGANAPAFTLADMDGDGKLDLLVTRRCNDTNVGTSTWISYRNTGAAFAANATTFQLPPGYAGSAAAPPFGDVGGSLACTSGANAPGFAFGDVDGDGKPDLLVTQKCNDPAVGSTTWLAYKNTGVGFAAAPTTLALPPGYTGTSPAFAKVAGAIACTSGANVPTFTLADMDGDGKPDLLVTRHCNDASVGTSSWWVYKGTGSGFAASAAAWSLPSGYSGGSQGPPFANVTGALACANGANVPELTLVDMDGDFRPDLVVTQRCNDANVGVTTWLVYKNTGSGFATNASSFQLPPGYTGQPNSPLASPFANLTGALACANGANNPEFTVVDMNADGRPDLLVTRRCNDVAVGTTTWNVHENTGSAFAPTATTLLLPLGYMGQPNSSMTAPFSDRTGALACASGANVPEFTLVDLSGDMRPDIVLTMRCNDAATGATRWRMHASTCL